MKAVASIIVLIFTFLGVGLAFVSIGVEINKKKKPQVIKLEKKVNSKSNKEEKKWILLSCVGGEVWADLDRKGDMRPAYKRLDEGSYEKLICRTEDY